MVIRKERDLELVNTILNSKGREKETAISELYYTYSGMVKNYVKKHFGLSDYDADDIVTVSLAKTLNEEKLAQFVPNYTFASWVIKIARNSALDFLRKRKRINTVSIDDFNTDGESDFQLELSIDYRTPEDILIDKDKMELIKKCFEKLTENQRRIIKLNLIDQYNDVKISEITGQKPLTIRTTISRAKSSIREMINQQKQRA